MRGVPNILGVDFRLAIGRALGLLAFSGLACAAQAQPALVSPPAPSATNSPLEQYQVCNEGRRT